MRLRIIFEYKAFDGDYGQQITYTTLDYDPEKPLFQFIEKAVQDIIKEGLDKLKLCQVNIHSPLQIRIQLVGIKIHEST